MEALRSFSGTIFAKLSGRITPRATWPMNRIKLRSTSCSREFSLARLSTRSRMLFFVCWIPFSHSGRTRMSCLQVCGDVLPRTYGSKKMRHARLPMKARWRSSLPKWNERNRLLTTPIFTREGTSSSGSSAKWKTCAGSRYASIKQHETSSLCCISLQSDVGRVESQALNNRWYAYPRNYQVKCNFKFYCVRRQLRCSRTTMLVRDWKSRSVGLWSA